MFQYATGRALSLRLRVPLKLDVRYYRRHSERVYLLHLLNVHENFPSMLDGALVRIAMKSRFKLIAAGLRAVAPGLPFTYFKDHDGFDPATLRATSGRIYLDGYWQNEAHFADAAERIRHELSFRDPPPANDLALLDEMKAVDAVCLHVRRGDYVTSDPAQSQHGTCTPEYYARAMAAIQDRVANPRYYVFSDNIQPGFPAVYVAHHVGKADHEDLRLMSGCRHFIIANSSFSWWGAWMSGHAGKIVIAPKVWFAAANRAGYNPAPAGWLRM
jgi:hypothetical protein